MPVLEAMHGLPAFPRPPRSRLEACAPSAALASWVLRLPLDDLGMQKYYT